MQGGNTSVRCTAIFVVDAVSESVVAVVIATHDDVVIATHDDVVLGREYATHGDGANRSVQCEPSNTAAEFNSDALLAPVASPLVALTGAECGGTEQENSTGDGVVLIAVVGPVALEVPAAGNLAALAISSASSIVASSGIGAMPSRERASAIGVGVFSSAR